MTVQQARDEFLQLRYDDQAFADTYQDTPEDFQEWIENYCINLGV